jgi:hypothetical protein
MTQPLHITGAHVWDGHDYTQRDLFTTDVVVEQRPANAITIDLSGYTIFPGLVNAHDHLELNHYPRTKYRERYDNASQWSADVNAHLDESPFKELRAYPLEDRCFIGGLKNLLCGATTVAHHNPPHKCLFKRDFPVRVLKKYGWAHSLYLSSDAEIIASYQSTPPDVPWFIHLAEGTDADARGEYRRLKALGCVAKNTVIVHGVGLTEDDTADAAPRVRGLVTCYTTNEYLLSNTFDLVTWHQLGGKIGIGSDSRLTAEGDLLIEDFHLASATIGYFPHREDWSVMWSLESAQSILGLNDVGHLRPGAKADWFLVPEGEMYRYDIPLVVRGGEPQIGDPEIMAKFPHIETVAARLDDREKSINVRLARQIARCTLKEPGLELLEDSNEPPLSRFWNGVLKR